MSSITPAKAVQQPNMLTPNVKPVQKMQQANYDSKPIETIGGRTNSVASNEQVRKFYFLFIPPLVCWLQKVHSPPDLQQQPVVLPTEHHLNRAYYDVTLQPRPQHDVARVDDVTATVAVALPTAAEPSVAPATNIPQLESLHQHPSPAPSVQHSRDVIQPASTPCDVIPAASTSCDVIPAADDVTVHSATPTAAATDCHGELPTASARCPATRIRLPTATRWI